jgi:hypothetical protein
MKTIIEIDKKTPVEIRDYDWKDSALTIASRKYLSNVPSSAYSTVGYLNYLGAAWEYHYGVVLNPTDIWYIILCELTSAIGKTPKDYAHLFTTTPEEKQEIVVLTGDVETIDPELVIVALKDLVPSNVDDFLPTFSTDNEFSRLAMNIAFCDLVSPYYNYSTMLCGIPAVCIGGTEIDWVNIQVKLASLLQLFSGSLHEYLLRCQSRVTEIIINAFTNKGNGQDFFSKMVRLTPCGSGHQFEMNGWILHFLNRDNCTESVMVGGMPTQISKMSYKNLDTGRTFQLFAGIFYSTFEQGFMIPRYNSCRIETTKSEENKKAQVEDLLDSMTLTSFNVYQPK